MIIGDASPGSYMLYERDVFVKLCEGTVWLLSRISFAGSPADKGHLINSMQLVKMIPY